MNMSMQPPVMNNFNYGPDPIPVTCFNCKRNVTTNISESINTLCCFLFGCFALCCCKDVEHRCPQCNVILGTYKAS